MKDIKLNHNTKNIIYSVLFGVMSTILLGMYDMVGGGGQFNRHYTNIFYSITLLFYIISGYFIIKNKGIKISYLLYLNLFGIVALTILGVYITYFVK